MNQTVYQMLLKRKTGGLENKFKAINQNESPKPKRMMNEKCFKIGIKNTKLQIQEN